MNYMTIKSLILFHFIFSFTYLNVPHSRNLAVPGNVRYFSFNPKQLGQRIHCENIIFN